MNSRRGEWGSNTRRTVKLLWNWWLGLFLLFVLVWGTAFWNYCQASWSGGVAAVLPQVQSLREEFVALQEAQTSLALAVWNQFRNETLTRQEWAEICRTDQTLFRCYYVDADNRSIWPDLSPAAPTALIEAGRASDDGKMILFWVSPCVQGRQYLARISHNHRGEWLIVELDLEHIYGSWLASKTAGLVTRLARTGRVQDIEIPVKTFLSDTSRPLPEMVVVLDRWRLLGRAGPLYLLILGVGSMGLLGFATALRIAGRAVQRELELAEANRYFVELVSHELRTPLSNICLHSEILAHNLYDESRVEHERRIFQEAQRMRNVLKNLADWCRGQDGDLKLHCKPESPMEVAQAAAERVGYNVAQIRDEAREQFVCCDRDATIQALSNLFDNALKYGGQRPEDLECRICVKDEMVFFEVQDRGPGLAEADILAVFDLFKRSSSNKPGTGIGLALARQYAENQKGRIWIQNRDGGGCCATLCLPVSS